MSGKRAVVTALVGDCCRRGPAMIVVEDLHWADPQILVYLATVATAVANGPGLLAITSRVRGIRWTRLGGPAAVVLPSSRLIWVRSETKRR